MPVQQLVPDYTAKGKALGGFVQDLGNIASSGINEWQKSKKLQGHNERVYDNIVKGVFDNSDELGLTQEQRAGIIERLSDLKKTNPEGFEQSAMNFVQNMNTYSSLGGAKGGFKMPDPFLDPKSFSAITQQGQQTKQDQGLLESMSRTTSQGQPAQPVQQPQSLIPGQSTDPIKTALNSINKPSGGLGYLGLENTGLDQTQGQTTDSTGLNYLGLGKPTMRSQIQTQQQPAYGNTLRSQSQETAIQTQQQQETTLPGYERLMNQMGLNDAQKEAYRIQIQQGGNAGAKALKELLAQAQANDEIESYMKKRNIDNDLEMKKNTANQTYQMELEKYQQEQANKRQNQQISSNERIAGMRIDSTAGKKGAYENRTEKMYVRGLRGDFEDHPIVKTIPQIMKTVNSVEGAFSNYVNAKGNDKRSAKQNLDQVLFYAFNKVNDPTSAVLPGEFERVAIGQGIAQETLNKLRAGVTGGMPIDDNLRQRMLTTLKMMKDVSINQSKPIYEQYKNEAVTEGLDPYRIVGGYSQFFGESLRQNTTTQNDDPLGLFTK